MGLFRRLRGPVATLALLLLLLLPMLGLPLAAFSDSLPGQSLRLTLFHFALTIADPYTWSCLRNSLVGASVVAFLSMVVGIGLARILDQSRFWGRPVLSRLAWLPGAYSPFFAALGASWLLGSFGPLAAGSDSFGSTSRFLQDWGGWVAWIWVETAFGVSWVALAVLGASRRLDPSWTEAARWQGASRRYVWKTITWPLVRPSAASASATVFALTLLEPGAPLLLGLRQTLPFQIVEAAIVPHPAHLPRVAALAMFGLGSVLVGRLLIAWWGGTDVLGLRQPDPRSFQANDQQSATLKSKKSVVPRGAYVARFVLLGWVVLALAPSLAVPWMLVNGLGSTGELQAGLTSLADLADILGGSETRQLLIESALLGLTVAGLNLVLGWIIAGSVAEVFFLRMLRAIPPLILGVGVLMLPTVLAGLAGIFAVLGLGLEGEGGPIGLGFERWANRLDPYQTPGVLLTWGVVLTQLPWMILASKRGRQNWRPQLFEAAKLQGASRWRIWKTVAWPLAGPPLLSTWLLTAVLAATALTPALILAPTSEARPIGPGVLYLRQDPQSQRQAAALATVAMLLGSAVLPIALRHQREHPGDSIRV